MIGEEAHHSLSLKRWDVFYCISIYEVYYILHRPKKTFVVILNSFPVKVRIILSNLRDNKRFLFVWFFCMPVCVFFYLFIHSRAGSAFVFSNFHFEQTFVDSLPSVCLPCWMNRLWALSLWITLDLSLLSISDNKVIFQPIRILYLQTINRDLRFHVACQIFGSALFNDPGCCVYLGVKLFRSWLCDLCSFRVLLLGLQWYKIIIF